MRFNHHEAKSMLARMMECSELRISEVARSEDGYRRQVASRVLESTHAFRQWEGTHQLLMRDIVLSVAFFITLATGRGPAVPARFGGKVVTLLQLLTLFAFILKSSYFLRPLAWATAAVALYAIYDYNQPFFRKLNAND